MHENNIKKCLNNKINLAVVKNRPVSFINENTNK